jgi:energy-coupling factor transport system ATP-binding protein
VRILLESIGVTRDEGLPSATRALGCIDLSVSDGERLAVIGPTGSGKTTLLEVMAGLSAPTSGRAFLEPPRDGATLKDVVGLAYQFPESQFFEETVFADVAFGPLRQGLSDSDVSARVLDALSRAGLPPEAFADRPPLSLSAGEKRRAAIAGILALGRPFLLLDEPTAGLDPATAARVESMMVAEAGSGVGVVFVTHDLELVERAASRIVVLSEGDVLADGPAEAVLSDGGLLGRVGLEQPPDFALVGRLREVDWPDADRVAGLLAGDHATC